MISVQDALDAILALATPVTTETVPLCDAAGRVLAEPVVARLTQPPFATSMMDGYAVNNIEAEPASVFKVIGESAAGHGFDGEIKAGEAVRIFTGAPMPKGADRVVIQEDVYTSGKLIHLNPEIDTAAYVRPVGADFSKGDTLAAPRRLTPADIALIASMNVPAVVVAKRPVVAVISTGDELVVAGSDVGPDQIVASNGVGLRAMFENFGADVRLLPIARDSIESLTTVFELAKDADVIVTSGGASDGDHDLVAVAAETLGLEQSFYKVAMRPGKPMMAGKMRGATVIGVPGNPVSSLVCAQVFVLPLLAKMMGIATPNTLCSAPLASPISANGPREHYMRARVDNGQISILSRQDSGVLSALSKANILVVRPPHDPARALGEVLSYFPIA